MSLQTEVTSRYADAKLRRLTNPESRSPTSADATRLALACTDAESEFFRWTGVTFDVTNAQHVAAAVELVVLLLMERGTASVESTSQHRARTEQKLQGLAKVTGRDRPDPKSSGAALTLTPEVESGADVRPKFDSGYLRGYRAKRPGGG